MSFLYPVSWPLFLSAGVVDKYCDQNQDNGPGKNRSQYEGPVLNSCCKHNDWVCACWWVNGPTDLH